MRRTGWTAVAGLGIAGLLLAVPAARATDEAKHGSTATGQSSDHPSSASDKAGSDKGSEARGSGQAGSSTGARPGEVTGAPSAAGGTSEREQHAATAADKEISGKVEKYDRESRTLSLSSSDTKLKITDDTQVMKDGDRISPGQIMEGDDVRASYSGTGDTVEVVRVEIVATSAAPAGAGAAPGSTSGPSSGSGTTGGSPKETAPGKSSETGSGSTGTKQQ
jgi:colicin import membrane protein